MGYSLPAAIGAQMARPDKEVWCVVGDGCFQMTLQELAVLDARSACRSRSPLHQQRLPGHGPPVAAAVLDSGNFVAVDLSGAPDYVKLAQAYGIPAWRVTEPSELARGDRRGDGVSRARRLIEFRVAREENVFPMVPSGGTSLAEVIPDTPYVARGGRDAGAGGGAGPASRRQSTHREAPDEDTHW